jgi:starvation-inducible outer membrane lipoprotein
MALTASLLLLQGCSRTPQEIAKSDDRDKIKFCWSQQEKKSLTPDEARFIAGACEMKEQKFREKYGHAP